MQIKIYVTHSQWGLKRDEEEQERNERKEIKKAMAWNSLRGSGEVLQWS